MGTLIFSSLLSIPFYFIWNKLAPIYFYQLPPVYQHVPFLDCAGIFVLIAIVKLMLMFPVRIKQKHYKAFMAER